MKAKTLNYISVLILSLILIQPPTQAQNKVTGQVIKVSIQRRIPSELDEGAFTIVNEIQEWNANETAIIIYDMWDKHSCLSFQVL